MKDEKALLAHYEDGCLRAWLDGESDIDSARLNAHLSSCPTCRTRLEDIRARSLHIARVLSMPADEPDLHGALARFRSSLDSTIRPLADAPLQPALVSQKGKNMNKHVNRKTPGWLAPLGALVLAIALLALPPVRAIADQLLQIFRVQTVLFVPVSDERIKELEKLDVNGKSLFVAEPNERVKSESRSVADAAEASAAAGFDIAEPAGETATSYSVSSKSEVDFQVDVAAARQILQMTGVDDVSIPDALGSQPIVVKMGEVVQSRYASNSGTIELIQGRSPEVALPDGVDLSQLGKAALRILGMAPEQAAALSSQIDWSTTLIFPFPANVDTMRQVSINGVPGMLISETHGSGASLYWQRGEQFYILHSSRSYGDALSAMVQLAESVR